MYVCMYACIYIRMKFFWADGVCMYVCLYVVRVYVCVYMHACMYICMKFCGSICSREHACVCHSYTCIHTYIHTYKYTSTTCIQTYMRTYIHIELYSCGKCRIVVCDTSRSHTIPVSNNICTFATRKESKKLRPHACTQGSRAHIQYLGPIIFLHVLLPFP